MGTRSPSPPPAPRHVPEKVPEKTPGAWLTKLSMTAPGLRERALGAGLLPGGEPLRVLQSTCRRGEMWGQPPEPHGTMHHPDPSPPPYSQETPPGREQGQQPPPALGRGDAQHPALLPYPKPTNPGTPTPPKHTAAP